MAGSRAQSWLPGLPRVFVVALLLPSQCSSFGLPLPPRIRARSLRINACASASEELDGRPDGRNPSDELIMNDPIDSPEEVESRDVFVDAPLPVHSFADLGVRDSRIIANLAAANISAPNALQCASHGALSEGRDVVVHAHTGSGKTLAFLLPLLDRLEHIRGAPQLLVLSPSRELAYQVFCFAHPPISPICRTPLSHISPVILVFAFQIYRVAALALSGTGLEVAAIAGGANPGRQVEKLKRDKPQVVVGTAGRVSELAFEWSKLSLRQASLTQVSHKSLTRRTHVAHKFHTSLKRNCSHMSHAIVPIRRTPWFPHVTRHCSHTCHTPLFPTCHCDCLCVCRSIASS